MSAQISTPGDLQRWPPPLPPAVWAVAIALLCGVGAAIAANLAIDWRARGRLYASVDAVPPREVGLILGASVYPGGQPSRTLRHRLQAGLELFRAGKVNKLIVSGDHGAASYDEPNAMRRWLVARGVPSRAVFVDHAGFRTLDSASRTRLVFDARGVVICSQRFHLPRAIFLARHWGLDAVGLVADDRSTHRRINAVREGFAKVRAVMDTYWFGLGPRFAGPPIDLNGPASQTHDRQTGER